MKSSDTAVERVRAAMTKHRRAAGAPISPRKGPLVLSTSYLRRFQQRVRRAG